MGIASEALTMSAGRATSTKTDTRTVERVRDDRLREALAVVVSTGDAPESVRDEIVASWQRSTLSGLSPDHFEVPHHSDVEGDGLLARAAGPVLEQLAEDLAFTRVSALLTDGQGRLIDRRASDASLRARLDRISLAPGFVYAEEAVGTNAIGTALETRGPSLVEAQEHFADALTGMACAAAPITDPRDGRLLGAVDLTCSAEDAGALMLPLARRAAREVEQRIVDEAHVAERAMLQRFLRERRRTKGPFVFVNERTMITNAAADRLVGTADQAMLWDCATRLLAQNRADRLDLVLTGGTSVAARCEPVVDGGVRLGAVLRLEPREPSSSSTGHSDRVRFGWESLTETERSVTDLVARGLTNRQVAERIFVSRHTVDFHLRSIFRKLDCGSRVDLTRRALEHEIARSDTD